MKQAVCALIQNDLGEILTISRKGNINDLNLPGGKVEAGETFTEALRREVWEEVGLTIINPVFVFSDICEGEVPYDTRTFSCKHVGNPTALEAGTVVQWVKWERLMADTNSFAVYNRKLFYAITGFASDKAFN